MTNILYIQSETHTEYNECVFNATRTSYYMHGVSIVHVTV